MTTKRKFNAEAFYSALNAERLSRQLTWKDVAEETGVQASTLSRMGNGARPGLNGLAALLTWSNLKAEMFIPGSIDDEEAEPLARITALLRTDPNLSTANAKLVENLIISTYTRLKGT